VHANNGLDLGVKLREPIFGPNGLGRRPRHALLPKSLGAADECCARNAPLLAHDRTSGSRVDHESFEVSDPDLAVAQSASVVRVGDAPARSVKQRLLVSAGAMIEGMTPVISSEMLGVKLNIASKSTESQNHRIAM